MALERLLIHGFRNLDQVDIVFDPRLNFVHGLNGAGKSSLLEAIHFLGVGRSFRTRKYTRLVNRQVNKFELFAQLKNIDGSTTRIGISKGRGVSQLKLDGEPISKAADLARLTPIQVINSQSFDLLEGGPKQRRQFIDWLVFHVKHSYGQLWAHANRCLKQRNALLRDEKVKRKDFEFWDSELIALTEQISVARREVIEPYLNEANRLLSECPFVRADETPSKARLDIRFIQGWPDEQGYNEALAKSFDRDRALGYTSLGFHKADLTFEIDNLPLVEVYSRGQQKAIVSGLYLAKFKTLAQLIDKAGVLLVDDLPAEMDENNIALFSGWVNQLANVQCIVTGIDLNDVIQKWLGSRNQSSCKVFHVKHGQINEEPCNWSYS